jgi:hypothetical protein
MILFTKIWMYGYWYGNSPMDYLPLIIVPNNGSPHFSYKTTFSHIIPGGQADNAFFWRDEYGDLSCDLATNKGGMGSLTCYPNSHDRHVTGWWFGTWILYFPFHIWDVILPIDELHHFSRWLFQHPTSIILIRNAPSFNRKTNGVSI